MTEENSNSEYEDFDEFYRDFNFHYLTLDVDFIRTLWTLDTIGFGAAPHKGRFGPCLGAFLADTRRVFLPTPLLAECLMHPEFRDGRLRPFLQAIEDQGRFGVNTGPHERYPVIWGKFRSERVDELYAVIDPDRLPFAERYPLDEYSTEHFGKNFIDESPIKATEYELFAREFGDNDIRTKMNELNVRDFESMYEFDPDLHSYPIGFNKNTRSGYRTPFSKWGDIAEREILGVFHTANAIRYFARADEQGKFVYERWFPGRLIGSNDPTFIVAEDIADPQDREIYRAWVGSISLLTDRIRLGRMGTSFFRPAFRAPWYHLACESFLIATATSFDYLIQAVLDERLTPEHLIQAAQCLVRIAGPERLLVQPASLRPPLADNLDPLRRLAIEGVWEIGVVPPADNGIAVATRLPLRTARYHWTALDHRLNAKPTPTVAQAKQIVETTLKQTWRESLARGARREGIVDFPRFVAFLRNQHENPEPGRPKNMIVPPETLQHIEKIAEREMFHVHLIAYGLILEDKIEDHNRVKLRRPELNYFDLDADDVLRNYATLGYNYDEIYADMIGRGETPDLTHKPYAGAFLDPWVYPFQWKSPRYADYNKEFPPAKGSVGAFTEEYFRELYANYPYVFKAIMQTNYDCVAEQYFHNGYLIALEEGDGRDYLGLIGDLWWQDYHFGMWDNQK